MHFTGTIWRPPYEATAALLQVTAGCTHNKCKFCTLYEGVPFTLSPLAEVEEDLSEIGTHCPNAKRVYLTGANPFVLSFEKLKTLALLVKKYLPKVESIGCFSRISDIAPKTPAQLKELHKLGIDGLNIGVETADDPTLAFMNKGYVAADIIEQCKKLDDAGITYNFIYLNGLAGAGNGERSALASARIFNQTKPKIINVTALTVFPESGLYQEVQNGNYQESGEQEKLTELKTLLENLDIETTILANTISNTTPMQGIIPQDKQSMVSYLQKNIDNAGEHELESYRKSIHHL